MKTTRRDEVTGRECRTNLLNIAKLSSDELDRIMLEDCEW